jgi:hypothetical protein
MNGRIRALGRFLTVLCLSGCLFQFGAGCNRALQNNIEVLFAADASPSLLYNSWVFNKLGAGVLSFFNQRPWS